MFENFLRCYDISAAIFAAHIRAERWLSLYATIVIASSAPRKPTFTRILRHILDNCYRAGYTDGERAIHRRNEKSL